MTGTLLTGIYREVKNWLRRMLTMSGITNSAARSKLLGLWLHIDADYTLTPILAK